MAPKKEKSLSELIEDAEDKLAEASDGLQKVKNKIEEVEEEDEFERGLP
tara:strand:+ start:181 stop:327 length:147 start_codon:yes stop_codon:yes gene_type:complete